MPEESSALRPILLVDDVADDRKIVLDQLERARVQNPVVACEHGAKAMSHLLDCWRSADPSQWPCLLFLDLHMPLMSGFEVLEWLKAQPNRHEMKVVVVSSTTDPLQFARARGLGADAFLMKFPSAQCLASIVRVASSILACRIASSAATAPSRPE